MFRHRELVGLTTQVGWADKMANLLVLCSSDFWCQFWADSAQNRCQYRIAKCLANCANLSSIKVLRNNLCFVRSADPLNEQLKSTYKHRLIQTDTRSFSLQMVRSWGAFMEGLYILLYSHIYIYISLVDYLIRRFMTHHPIPAEVPRWWRPLSVFWDLWMRKNARVGSTGTGFYDLRLQQGQQKNVVWGPVGGNWDSRGTTQSNNSFHKGIPGI